MNSTSELIQVNADRLWQSLMDMAQIGPGLTGGTNRQALTSEDGEARQLFQLWCEVEGCTVAIDRVGNMFATRDGIDPTALPVYIGSHLDTQPTGGKFDGVLGVLAGLETIRTLNDHDVQTRRPIVVTNWTNEEGSRFAPSMMGSGVFAGRYDETWVYSRADSEGLLFGDELEKIGFLGSEKLGQRKIHAYFELHIEQGPILEREQTDIGIVTHAQGLTWLKVHLTGKESHAGATPMPGRRDAAMGMARLIQLVNEIALRHGSNSVGTVGQMDIYPNSTNTIPGGATFTIDFRSPSSKALSGMVERFLDEAKSICADSKVEVSTEVLGGFEPVTFDEGCIDMVRKAVDAFGYKACDIVSGAGHDACSVNGIAPATMIMCPCVDGLSHHEAENILQEWATAGANVLMNATFQAADSL
ncbi:Zn-dependent hydrolase [uncultured Tateyamaria sp.]|uniref:Zn-dependent hydrolase n=1 Tax=uncultured Tateyamaria sp. TaxID=455651 RepID=UPI002613257D|nr:Zn-dependent hydrolase [uncultured Tateyamaria sp.]